MGTGDLFSSFGKMEAAVVVSALGLLIILTLMLYISIYKGKCLSSENNSNSNHSAKPKMVAKVKESKRSKKSAGGLKLKEVVKERSSRHMEIESGNYGQFNNDQENQGMQAQMQEQMRIGQYNMNGGGMGYTSGPPVGPRKQRKRGPNPEVDMKQAVNPLFAGQNNGNLDF